MKAFKRILMIFALLTHQCTPTPTGSEHQKTIGEDASDNDSCRYHFKFAVGLVTTIIAVIITTSLMLLQALKTLLKTPGRTEEELLREERRDERYLIRKLPVISGFVTICAILREGVHMYMQELPVIAKIPCNVTLPAFGVALVLNFIAVFIYYVLNYDSRLANFVRATVTFERVKSTVLALTFLISFLSTIVDRNDKSFFDCIMDPIRETFNDMFF